MELQDKIAAWAPKGFPVPAESTVGKTLNQSRGFAEAAFQNTQKLLKLVNPDALAAAIASKIDPSQLTTDQIKQAVKDALAEGVDN